MGLPAFLEDEPVCAVRDGRVYMAWDDFNLVIPIECWHRNVVLGNEAIAKWYLDRLGQGEVVYLPRNA